MFEIGSFQARVCQGLSRRAFLQAGALAPLGLSLAAGRAPAYGEVRAKSVLFVWLWGAPSHLDTFDPKPNAQPEFRGPFSTINTRTTGLRFTELFPRIAARSDRFALVRSNKNFHAGHLEAGTTGLTGNPNEAAGTLPNFGSILSRHRGGRQLPGFISIGRGNPRDVVGPMKGYGGGICGRSHDPFPVACSEKGEIDIPNLRLLDGLTPQHLLERRQLVESLDQLRRQGDSGDFSRWDANQRRAYSLLTTPEARAALDLSREQPRIREAYGHTAFGQSCLLARRLVEARVPYVQVNWSQYVEAMTPNCDFGWDTHIYNFEMLMDRHGPIFDRVFSALLDDLRERGLLDTTLVVAMGEFGRTPRINGQASRDHWPQCYFSLWAGAGVRPGVVVGESDRQGNEPITEPITPLMVGTTILDLAGVHSQARAEMGVLAGGRFLHELF